MIDLNKKEELERLRAYARSKQGQLILEYFNQELKKLKYSDINTDLPNEQVGQAFKAIKETRKFIENKIKFLTSE